MKKQSDPSQPADTEIGHQNLSAKECRAARALLRWPQVRLGAKSNVSEATIRDFESSRRILRPERITAIRQALELAGVTFTADGPLLGGKLREPWPGKWQNDPQQGIDTAPNGRAPRTRRSWPLKGEDAEVRHVVEVHDLSPSQARELVRRHGNDWRKIDEAAKSYKHRR